MQREVTVTYSPEIIRFAVWKFWTRSIGLGTFIAFIILCIAFLVVLMSGDRSWLLGFMGAAVLVCAFVLILTYFLCLNRSMDKFKQMEKPTAKFSFTDEYIGIESDMGKSELSWKLIQKVWQYPSVWLVFLEKQSYITLPTESIDEELKQFIILKLKQIDGLNL